MLTRRASLLAAGAFLAGCSAPPRPAPTARPEPDLLIGDLADLTTSAGLRWSVDLSPRHLWNDESLRPHLELILRDERLDALARTTGVDLRQAPQTVVASYPDATAWLVRHRQPPAELERRFRDRLTTDVTRSVHGHQRVVVHGGIGRRHRELALLGRDVGCFQFGGSTKGPARIAVLYSQDELARIPTLASDPLRATARTLLGDAPATFFWPGPFEGPWADGLRGLLGACVALAITASPQGGGVAVAVALLGDFAAPGTDPLPILAAAWDDLARADLGHLLGLDRPLAEPTASLGPAGLVWEVRLALRPLLEGLAAATVEDARTFLGRPLPPPPADTVDAPSEGTYPPPTLTPTP